MAHRQRKVNEKIWILKQKGNNINFGGIQMKGNCPICEKEINFWNMSTIKYRKENLCQDCVKKITNNGGLSQFKDINQKDARFLIFCDITLFLTYAQVFFCQNFCTNGKNFTLTISSTIKKLI